MTAPRASRTTCSTRTPTPRPTVDVGSFGELIGLNDFLAATSPENPITSVYFTHGYGFGVAEFETSDPDQVERVIAALERLEIGGVIDMDVTDWYPGVSLTVHDGTELWISFNGGWLEKNGLHYTVSGINDFYDEMDRILEEIEDSVS